jgi:predicted metal-binding protein
MRTPDDAPRPVRRPWRSSLVLVCRECDGVRGFGPKQVRKALRTGAKAELPPKAVRVATVSCLDVCPKRAVTVAVAGVGETAVIVSGPQGTARVVEHLRGALEDEA